MATMFFKIDGDEIRYSNTRPDTSWNEGEEGKRVNPILGIKDAPSYGKSVVIEPGSDGLFHFPEDAGWMFAGDTNWTLYDTDKGDFSDTIRISAMFAGSKASFIHLDNLSFPNVTRAEGLCRSCTNLLNFSMNNTSLPKVTNFDALFAGDTNLNSIEFQNLSVGNTIEYTFSMFDNCLSLEEVDISRIDLSNAIRIDGMFYNCTSLKKIMVYENTDGSAISSIVDSDNLFTNCTNLPNWDGETGITRANNTKGGYFGSAKKWSSYIVFMKV